MNLWVFAVLVRRVAMLRMDSSIMVVGGGIARVCRALWWGTTSVSIVVARARRGRRVARTYCVAIATIATHSGCCVGVCQVAMTGGRVGRVVVTLASVCS